jgi:HEAT repeat protein
MLLDLKNPDLKVRQSAVEALVRLAALSHEDAAIRESRKTLVRVVEDKHEDAEVRGQIVRALAMTSVRKRIDQDIIPTLTQVLADPKDDEGVRSWIAMCLPDLATPEVAGPAILAALRSESNRVRVNAAQQVGRVQTDPDKAIAWLKQAVNDPDTPLRAAAVSLACMLAESDRRAMEVVLRGMSDRDPTIRDLALQSLRPGRALKADATDVRVAVEKLQQDPVPGVTMSAAVLLIKLDPEHAPKHLAVIIDALRSDQPSKRESAARALALGGSEYRAAIPALQLAVKDPSERIRVHAAMALGRITGDKEPSSSILAELGKSKDAEVMMWARGYRAILLVETTKDSGKSRD